LAGGELAEDYKSVKKSSAMTKMSCDEKMKLKRSFLNVLFGVLQDRKSSEFLTLASHIISGISQSENVRSRQID